MLNLKLIEEFKNFKECTLSKLDKIVTIVNKPKLLGWATLIVAIASLFTSLSAFNLSRIEKEPNVFLLYECIESFSSSTPSYQLHFYLTNYGIYTTYWINITTNGFYCDKHNKTTCILSSYIREDFDNDHLVVLFPNNSQSKFVSFNIAYIFKKMDGYEKHNKNCKYKLSYDKKVYELIEE